MTKKIKTKTETEAEAPDFTFRSYRREQTMYQVRARIPATLDELIAAQRYTIDLYRKVKGLDPDAHANHAKISVTVDSGALVYSFNGEWSMVPYDPDDDD